MQVYVNTTLGGTDIINVIKEAIITAVYISNSKFCSKNVIHKWKNLFTSALAMFRELQKNKTTRSTSENYCYWRRFYQLVKDDVLLTDH